MTEEQITAIAKEYAKENGGNIVLPIRLIVECVLYWMKDKYCLVERKKVMEAFQANTDRLNQKLPVLQEAYLKGRRMQLKDLFGTEMFNHNDE